MVHTNIRRTVLRSLAAISATREAEFYAQIFQNQSPEKFALIIIDPDCLKKLLQESLVSDLKILCDLGLTPLLLIGPLCKDQTQIKFHTHKLSRTLDMAGIPSSQLNCASYEFERGVHNIVKSGRIPVLELSQPKQGYALFDLVVAFEPAKVIFLQPSGGIRKNGQRVAVMNIDNLAQVKSEYALSKGQERVLSLIENIAPKAKHSLTYVMASPLNLLPELFTTKGSGTMLRKGALIKSYKSFRGINKTRLFQSIETAFSRKLADGFMKRRFSRIFLDQHYRGGAIFEELSGLAYLSKFWVTPEAQGEGIAADIWTSITSSQESFFWRSKKDNQFNDWYMKMCDGMQVCGHWRVFWIGLSAAEISGAIWAASNAAIDFEQ